MKWYLKQLLPLWYHTSYKENGIRYQCDWKMWFGISYKITKTILDTTE